MNKKSVLLYLLTLITFLIPSFSLAAEEQRYRLVYGSTISGEFLPCG